MNTKESPFGEEFKVLIQERIKHFWGYGNLNAPYWFIGMEEGYNAETEDLYKRFKASEGKQICDIADLKIDPGSYSLFADGAPLNRTYRRLIQMMLYAERKSILIRKLFVTFKLTSLGEVTQTTPFLN
jgi:hypothetical protein